MELKEIILELEEEKESLQEFIHTTEWNKTNCDSLYNIVDMIKECLLGIQFVDQKLNLEIIKKASLADGSTKEQLMDVAQLLLGK